MSLEVYYYKCAACGFIHQVPSYWMDYAPEETREQPHFAPETGALCHNTRLDYAGEGDSERE